MTSYDVDALRAREFPWAAADDVVFLNHASTGPLPQRTLEATAEFNAKRAALHRMSDQLQFATLAKGRALVAKLIGATTEEIALATNTTYGLNLAAFSLPLSPGDVIVTPDKEFPANIYPWMQAAKIRGAEYRRVHPARGAIDNETVLAALDEPRVKILSVSWVGFAFGSRLDLRILGDACRERGIYFVVDAMQGLGPLTLDLSKLHVDILACGAQKWLLGPWGAGFVYVQKDLVQRLEPHDVSWLDVRGSEDFRRLMDYDLTWRDDARRFEFITLPYQDFAGMNASLELIDELGPSNIAAHVAGLTQHVVDWASDRDGIELVTPSSPERRAGIVSVRPADPDAASVRLKQARVVHTVREGAVRLSPHCYNTIEEVDYALKFL